MYSSLLEPFLHSVLLSTISLPSRTSKPGLLRVRLTASKLRQYLQIYINKVYTEGMSGFTGNHMAEEGGDCPLDANIAVALRWERFSN